MIVLKSCSLRIPLSIYRSSRSPSPFLTPIRHFRPTGHRRSDSVSPLHNADATTTDEPQWQEKKLQGAVSRRLAQLREGAVTGADGSYAAQVALEATSSGNDKYEFSEDLKRQLEKRIAHSNFRHEHPQAFATVSLSSSADRVARDTAAATPWTGTESTEAASRRMLNDSYRPVKAPARVSSSTVPFPRKVDTGRASTPSGKVSSQIGARIASARDKTSVYSLANNTDMSPEEKDEYRRQLKERVQPASRAVPATLRGLASLANERIDDAIARGQFKNIPRGAKLERDHVASSPFLDTTEYFLNKIIQKQEIVPPWIEKQQEVTSTASKFRSRLRADWKRHVARLIASRGGDLVSQVRLAEAYAAAEARLAKPAARDEETGTKSDEEESGPQNDFQEEVPPFRDPSWQATEHSYHTLAIQNLNNLTRSYNLMAPELAKKPYFSLDRELAKCFADVAPHIADTIRERSWVPASLKIENQRDGSRSKGGLIARLGGPDHVVYEERGSKRYGLREFWRDLWRK